MVAEMVPEKELQPTAFSIMPLVWSIGSVFGPSFGGFFARPAEQYPSVFGNSWLFKTYPFLLPNLMACIFFFISVVTAVLFLKETLETKRHDRDWGLIIGEKLIHPFRKTRSKHLQKRSFVDDEATAPLLAHSGLSKAHKIAPQPALRDIFTRQVRVCIFAYTLLALHSVSYDQILAVFLSYPLQTPDSQNTHLPFHFSGGFGLSSGRIGTIFTIYGFACGIIQFLLFPPLCSKFGALNCFRVSSKSFDINLLMRPCVLTQSSSHPIPSRLHGHTLQRAHPGGARPLYCTGCDPACQELRRHHRLPLHHHPLDQRRALAAHTRHS